MAAVTRPQLSPAQGTERVVSQLPSKGQGLAVRVRTRISGKRNTVSLCQVGPSTCKHVSRRGRVPSKNPHSAQNSEKRVESSLLEKIMGCYARSVSGKSQDKYSKGSPFSRTPGHVHRKGAPLSLRVALGPLAVGLALQPLAQLASGQDRDPGCTQGTAASSTRLLTWQPRGAPLHPAPPTHALAAAFQRTPSVTRHWEALLEPPAVHFTAWPGPQVSAPSSEQLPRREPPPHALTLTCAHARTLTPTLTPFAPTRRPLRPCSQANSRVVLPHTCTCPFYPDNGSRKAPQ